MKVLIVVHLWSKFHVNSFCSFEIRRGSNRPPGVTGSRNSPGGIGLKHLKPVRPSETGKCKEKPDILRRKRKTVT